MKTNSCAMKTLFVVCFLLPALGYADELEGYFAATVQVTNGLTLGISLKDTLGTNSTEHPIGLDFKAPANVHSMFFVPKNEYFVRMQLFDSNNNLVPKTTLGSSYGQDFDNLRWNIGKFANQPHGPRTASDTWIGGAYLPKLSDLFAISKPGQYRLKLEAQIMLLYLDTRAKQARQIIRFPVAEITVVCPQDAQAP
jgi:hypothetical protein